MISSASHLPTNGLLPSPAAHNPQSNQLVEAGHSGPALTGAAVTGANKTEGAASDAKPAANERQAGQPELTEEEQKQVRELQATDRRVRAHEAAHAAAAGGLAKGGPSFTYQTGPDGRSYAVGGEVQIDTSAVSGDPTATLRKAEQIRRAALAPADPSSQDRSVAAAAAQMAAQARAEMISASGEANGGEGEPGQPDEASVAPAGTETPASKNTTCPSCGGAHAGHAHEGLSAYADQSSFTPAAAEQIAGLFAAA